MKAFKFLVIISTGIVLLSACKKDKEETPVPTGPATSVAINISGVVLDTYGSPLPGVEVKCGSKTATTDANGTYCILNYISPLDKYAITFSKANYFKGTRTFCPVAGKFNVAEVTLIPYYWTNASQTTFASTTAYTLYIGSTGCSILFPADNWIDESTSAVYSGNVTVYAAFLDPTDVNYGKYAYGGLMKGRTATDTVYIEPHSGLIVEIYGTSGEKLNLNPATKANATITFQIPTGITNAPATIDLWDFDMAAGIAGAGGSATKQGDKYVGEATHFSYWSCEKVCSGNPALINGRVTDGNLPVANVPVIVGGNLVFTDANGNFSQKVPAGILVKVGVKPGYLGTSIAPLSVGPLANDEVYTIPTDFVIPSVSYLNGQLINCTGAGVQGHVMFNGSGFVSSAVSDAGGFFKIPITTAIYYGYVTAHGNTVTESQSVSITSWPYDMGQITLCPPVQTGPNEITIGGSTYNTFDGTKEGYVYMGSNTSIYISAANGDHIQILLNGTSTGTYTIDATNVYVNGTVNSGALHFESATGTITVTQFGSVGQLINGTFTANCTVNGPYTGKFSVVRQQDITF